MIPNRIAEHREKLGMSQRELGQKFKNPKHFTVISRWERGISIPSSEHLLELSSILMVSPDQILSKGQ